MKNYIIISLKHGTGESPMFWKANDLGYTPNPFLAGLYSQKQVDENPDYYNNGYGAVAIPVTNDALQAIGFKCSFDEKAIEKLFPHSKSKPGQ